MSKAKQYRQMGAIEDMNDINTLFGTQINEFKNSLRQLYSAKAVLIAKHQVARYKYLVSWLASFRLSIVKMTGKIVELQDPLVQAVYESSFMYFIKANVYVTTLDGKSINIKFANTEINLNARTNYERLDNGAYITPISSYDDLFINISNKYKNTTAFESLGSSLIDVRNLYNFYEDRGKELEKIKNVSIGSYTKAQVDLAAQQVFDIFVSTGTQAIMDQGKILYVETMKLLKDIVDNRKLIDQNEASVIELIKGFKGNTSEADILINDFFTSAKEVAKVETAVDVLAVEQGKDVPTPEQPASTKSSTGKYIIMALAAAGVYIATKD